MVINSEIANQLFSKSLEIIQEMSLYGFELNGLCYEFSALHLYFNNKGKKLEVKIFYKNELVVEYYFIIDIDLFDAYINIDVKKIEDFPKSFFKDIPLKINVKFRKIISDISKEI